MGSLDDFQDFRGRLDRNLEQLADADIDDRDRDQIRRWLQHADGNLKISSLGEYLNKIRISAERADIALVDMDADDFAELIFDFRHNAEYGRGDSGMTDETVRNYQVALRVFFTFLGREWVEDMEVLKVEPNRVTPDEILTQEDISALVDAATRPRDIALIEFLADTGARASMVGSLRVTDVDLDGKKATYSPNPDALGHKGAPQRPYPIIDSKVALRTYLRTTHPRPDEPDVALFHKLRDWEGGDGSLSSSHMSRRLATIANDAGIDKPVNPHNFRHSAITRMVLEGIPTHQIQHRVAWVMDSDMWETYVHYSGEEMNDEIFATAGIVDPDEGSTPRRSTCGNCTEPLAPHHEYCGRCGEPATEEARRAFDDAEESFDEDMIEARTPEERRVLARVRQMLRSDPSLQSGESSQPADHS